MKQDHLPPHSSSVEQDPLADSSTEQDPLADSSVGQELLIHDSDYDDPIAEEELLYLSEEEDPLTPYADPLATYDLKISSEVGDLQLFPSLYRTYIISRPQHFAGH